MAGEKANGSDEARPRVSILLVDDDVELCDLMREFFAQYGLDLETVHDGRRGLARALSASHDLVLLDIMVPVLDGLEILRQIRRRSDLPVIMLTARTAPSGSRSRNAYSVCVQVSLVSGSHLHSR